MKRTDVLSTKWNKEKNARKLCYWIIVNDAIKVGANFRKEICQNRSYFINGPFVLDLYSNLKPK